MPRVIRVASVDQIPVGRGNTITVDGVEVAVFNGGHGRYYAADPACPHEGGPLAQGLLDRGLIVRVEGPDLLIELP